MREGSPYILLLCLTMAACAPANNTTANLARENEHRLASLEESVQALNSQIAQLNNRVYEVRTKTGQKTSMTVVPMAAQQAHAAVPASAPHSAVSVKPAPIVAKPAPARKEAPKPKAAPARPAAPAHASAAPTEPMSNSAGLIPALPAEDSPAPQAGPTGSMGSQQLPPPQIPSEESPVTQMMAPASDMTLPAPPPAPMDAGAAVPVPQGNVPALPSESATPLVPVPLAPTSEAVTPVGQSQEAAQAVSTTPAKAAGGRSARARQGEQAAYNAALNAARSGRTAEGIRLFREFLQKYPNGPYAANADYWIGECLFAQGKYQEALSEFNQVNQSYPAHHKNADALLKAGITMSKMGDKEGAAAKFRSVITNFPNSEAARRARAMGGN